MDISEENWTYGLCLNYVNQQIIFFNKEKKFAINKWHHYLEIYDIHFKKFIFFI